MSLTDQVAAGLTAVGAEIKAVDSRRGLPAWAPPRLGNPYDARLNVYNAKASNLRGVRAGMARALNGGLMHIMCMGDSLAVGTNGATTVERTAAPRYAGKTIAEALGVRNAGGLSMAPAGPGSMTDRWATTGTVGITLPYLTLSTGASATYTSSVAGTTVDIWLSNASAVCTYQIDGGTAVAVTAGDGSLTLRKISITGLSDIVHSVRVNATGGTVYLTGVAVTYPTGVAVHNLAYGGSRTVSGGVGANWTDTNIGGLYNGRKQLWDAGGITPDLFLLIIGGSDIYNGDSTAAAIAGLTTMRNWYPDVDCVMAQAWEVPTTDPTAWDDYYAAKYQLADTLDIPFFDWRHRYADTVADAVTAGFTGPDNIHPAHGVNADMGLNIGQAMVGGGPGHPKVVTAPTGAPFSQLPDGTLFVEYTP